MTYFKFKDRVEDFIVEEMLGKEPEGEGDFHYIFFEKKNLATFDIINKIQWEFRLNRNMIGFAGLKDKQAITRQWITLSKRDVHKYCGGINNLLAFMRKQVKVLKATYGKKPLKLGNNKGNRFEIILRAVKANEIEKRKSMIENILSDISKKGVPNYFGEQRFGHRGRNWQTGEKLVLGEIKSLRGDNNTMAEKRFKVQAFSSYVFNVYLDMRQKAGKLYSILPGDIVVPEDGRYKHRTGKEQENTDRLAVTGPVVGYDLKHAKEEALMLEKATYQKLSLPADIEKGFQKFNIYGIRRAILLYPEHLSRSRQQGNNLSLQFDLTSGGYASVVIDYLENQLTQKRGEGANKK